MKTLACIRTMECGYAICSTFLPGDRQVAVGTKTGEILVYDIASSALVESVKAHGATVWSMHVRGDGGALVSGSADKDVKFWEFEAKAGGDNVRVVSWECFLEDPTRTFERREAPIEYQLEVAKLALGQGNGRERLGFGC